MLRGREPAAPPGSTIVVNSFDLISSPSHFRLVKLPCKGSEMVILQHDYLSGTKHKLLEASKDVKTMTHSGPHWDKSRELWPDSLNMHRLGSEALVGTALVFSRLLRLLYYYKILPIVSMEKEVFHSSLLLSIQYWAHNSNSLLCSQHGFIHDIFLPQHGMDTLKGYSHLKCVLSAWLLAR